MARVGLLILVVFSQSSAFVSFNGLHYGIHRRNKVLSFPLACNPASGDSSLDNDFEVKETKDKKVKMFGGWLDSSVAGRESLSDMEDEVTDELFKKINQQANFDRNETFRKLNLYLQRRRKANNFFKSGVNYMKTGQYKSAAEAFSQAVFNVPEGVQSREGGEYSIWLAEALDADGQKGKALLTIRACKAHSDRDVQRVAAGVEFVMLAPKLQTTPESFVWIDNAKLEDLKDGNRRTLYAPTKKLPAKYSLEWYMMQKPSQPEESDGAEAGVFLAASATILAGMVIYATYVAPVSSAMP